MSVRRAASKGGARNIRGCGRLRLHHRNRPLALLRRAERVPQAVGIGELIEQILVGGRGLEERPLLGWCEIAGGVTEQERLGIVTVRLLHRKLPPTLRSSV